MPDKLKYVWVVESSYSSPYGCGARRYVFVKDNAHSITVRSRGINLAIFKRSYRLFLYTEKKAKAAVLGFIKKKITELKKELSETEAAAGNVNLAIRVVEHEPYEKITKLILD